jgi:hypothetical protein
VDYSRETKSEYFSETKTSRENFSDDEDFEIPTPKRGRSEVIHIAEPRHGAPAAGEASSTVKKGRDIWIEVYLEKVKSWICKSMRSILNCSVH